MSWFEYSYQLSPNVAFYLNLINVAPDVLPELLWVSNANTPITKRCILFVTHVELKGGTKKVKPFSNTYCLASTHATIMIIILF